MQTKFNHLNFIKELVSFSPRQLKGERKTANFLIQLLKTNHIDYKLQNFVLNLPMTQRVNLIADGKEIICDACSLIGGKIKSKDKIISSMLSSIICQNDANINFNPHCSEISCANHYFAPAFAVGRKELIKILKAKKIEGEVLVKPLKHKAANILVGNCVNPKNICFAHYDSIKKGALDNASGVSILMGMILNFPDYLKDILYVFSACEELSYEKPIYYGYGYRIFEKQNWSLLQKAKKIVILECVGNHKPNLINEPKMLNYGFPIEKIKRIVTKTFLITGDFDKCMEIYHSDLDDGRGIFNSYLLETQKMLQKLMIT